MKKIITSFMVLFLLIGVGTKSYGQAAGDYVFIQPNATDSLWLHFSNWGISDGAGGTSAITRLPGVNDNVYIPANKLSAIIPSVTGSAILTTGSATITLSAANPLLAVGMNVTGTGVAANSKIVSMSGTSVVLSLVSTVAAASSPSTATLTFAYSTTITSSITLGSNTVALSETNGFVSPGMLITGVGIATGTLVQSVSGLTLTLSTAATATNATASLTFAQNPTCKTLNATGSFRSVLSFVGTGDINVGATGLVTYGSNASGKNLNVSGVVKSGGEFVVGDVIVNATGLLNLNSTMYCKNITNFGTVNATTGYRSAKSLFVGFDAKVPGSSDYTIINDGTFGDTAPRVPQGTTSGIKVLYSNLANSLTIKTSTPSISAYAFNIAQILPHANTKTTANTNLNIKESMSLLIHNGIGLSIQNNDTCPGTTRTCTIDPGVTVYLGYNFHANRNVTTNDQGNFIYNVYGTLDLGTYASQGNNLTATAANTTDFGLCMSTVAGNAGSLTFNLGDGTQAKGGTLILGSNVKLIKQRTQTIALNFKDFSTVRVSGNYGWTMNYQLLNSNVPALYLLPKNYYNLTFDGAKSIIPVAPVVKGAKTYTAGAYGVTNWVASTPGTTTVATSLYNGSSATSLPQGSIVYTGTKYYYVPVVRATSTYLKDSIITLVGDTALNFIKPLQGVVGNNLAANVLVLSGNTLSLSAKASATATQSNVFVAFTGIQGTTAPTGTSTNAFVPVFDGTQGLIYLGGYEFGAGVTAVNSPDATSNVFVYSTEKNKLVISNATEGDIASVYAVSGIKVATAKLTGDKTTLTIGSGIYLVKVNNTVAKVIVR